jgi:peptidoglycan/xylan/chitin deacetylase (PgdA/CDA1 family)
MPPDEKALVDRARAERLDGEAPDPGLRAAQVAELAASFEIGFHTRNHHPLPALSADELVGAMLVGRGDLAQVAGAELTAIAYPHGKADARVGAAARAAGYRAGFTTRAERFGADTDPMLVGRLYPSYGSHGRFALQLARAL